MTELVLHRFVLLTVVLVVMVASSMPVSGNPPPLAFPTWKYEDDDDWTTTTPRPRCSKGYRFINGRCRKVFTRSNTTAKVREIGLYVKYLCKMYCIIVLFWWGGHCCPMHCDLFKIDCAPPNLGIKTWICRLNFAQRPIFFRLEVL